MWTYRQQRIWKINNSKILCGLEIYDDGEVLLHDFLLEKGIYNKEINIIFQHPESSFDPRMTIFKKF